MSQLVDTLSLGEHRIQVSIRPDATPKALLECIRKGYVHLTFPDTRGQTTLYVPLDQADTKFNDADFETGLGNCSLAGKLTLDYERVRCQATINLSTMDGYGKLMRVVE